MLKTEFIQMCDSKVCLIFILSEYMDGKIKAETYATEHFEMKLDSLSQEKCIINN